MAAREVEPPEFEQLESSPCEVYVPDLGRESLVLQEDHHTEAHVLETIDAFLNHYPEVARLREDEQMWDDTGFWSARREDDNYIGLARATAESFLQENPDCEFALVLANQMNLFAFSTQSVPAGTFVDVYLNNTYLPFGELRRAVQLTLDALGDWRSFGYRIDDQWGILRAPATRKVSGHASRSTEIRPVAVVGAPLGTFHSAIVEWKFGNTPWTEFDSLRYLLASNRGPYWLDTDLISEKQFELSIFDPYFLRHCVVLECALERALEWAERVT